MLCASLDRFALLSLLVAGSLPAWTQDFLFGLHAVMNYEHDGPSEKWQTELTEEGQFGSTPAPEIARQLFKSRG